MLNRNNYIELIEKIRNTEIESLDEFIEKEIEPLRKDNELFIETLYKDIYYLLKDIDKKGENDLEFKNGDLVIEGGDIKLTGYQSRLHSLSGWLWIEICKKIIEKSPLSFTEGIKKFERDFLEKTNYTPEYKSELDRIKKSLKKERKQNLGEKENFWNKIFDMDNLELKPNFMGLGVNLKEVIKKFKK